MQRRMALEQCQGQGAGREGAAYRPQAVLYNTRLHLWYYRYRSHHIPALCNSLVITIH